MNNPTTKEIKEIRIDAGLTQTQAAKLIHCNVRTWQYWESGSHVMHPAFFELFNLKLVKCDKQKC